MLKGRDHYIGSDWAQNGSGLYLPPAPPSTRPPVAVDLFCGCGGMGLGFHSAGFHVAAACEWDATAACTYLHNLASPTCVIHFLGDGDAERLEAALKEWKVTPGANFKSTHGCDHFFFGDVRKLTGEAVLTALGMERGEVAVVTGGPPCQGFSHCNSKRNVMDPRNSLVFEFTRLCLEIQPMTLVMENVPGILNMTTPEGIPVVDAICLDLERGGWNYSALKKALVGQANARAATRVRGGDVDSYQEPEEQRGTAEEQLDLFAEVGA